jgi:hypothetical protein
MKKLVTLIILAVFTSCNDGDFDVPAFEFSETVSSCGEYLLYVTNSSKTEALILNLTTNEINEIEGTNSFSISSTITITYRIFEDAIGTSYFCQTIPPSSPNVIKELVADSGSVNITTTLTTEEDSNIYTYDISMSDLLFFDGNERIFFETLNFGTFTIEAL